MCSWSAHASWKHRLTHQGWPHWSSEKFWPKISVSVWDLKIKSVFILAGNLKLFTGSTQYHLTVHVGPRSWAFGSRVSYKVLMSSSKFFFPPKQLHRKPVCSIFVWLFTVCGNKWARRAQESPQTMSLIVYLCMKLPLNVQTWLISRSRATHRWHFDTSKKKRREKKKGKMVAQIMKETFLRWD